MSIVTELEDLGAPKVILEAGKEIEASQKAGRTPSAELVSFVQRWVGRHNGQNRWGK